MFRPSHITPLSVAIALALLSAPAVQADRFVLTSGGTLEGTLLNRQQTPRTTYEIETRPGVKVVLEAERVSEVARQKDVEAEYARVAPTYLDNVADQWKLAEWCRQHQLKAHRAIHLRRIIELQPDHVEARHGLGYVQLKGEWTTRGENLAAQGYQLYRGEWRSPQDIAMIEQREKAKLVAREWLGRLKSWRAQLNDPKFAATAYQRIASVRDASAVRPLCEMLRHELSRDVKALYIEVLGEINTADAIEAIVYVSLNDPDVEVFHACADTLERLAPPNLAKPYLDALKNDNNVRLNRAAHMLGRIGDKSALGPLIDVLVTSHRVVLSSGGGAKGDAISTSFSPDGGNSFQQGASQQVYEQAVQNREALDALTRLSSGQSFGYDQTSWRRWHAAENMRGGNVELKR